jgi:hypothetical protein
MNMEPAAGVNNSFGLEFVLDLLNHITEDIKSLLSPNDWSVDFITTATIMLEDPGLIRAPAIRDIIVELSPVSLEGGSKSFFQRPLPYLPLGKFQFYPNPTMYLEDHSLPPFVSLIVRVCI